MSWAAFQGPLRRWEEKQGCGWMLVADVRVDVGNVPFWDVYLVYPRGGLCRFDFYDGLSDTEVSRILDASDKLSRSRTTRSSNSDPRAMEKAGARTLTAVPEPTPKTAKFRVRYWYESAGGELLATDGPLLTRASADNERARAAQNNGVARVILDGIIEDTTYYQPALTTNHLRARVVVMPSLSDEKPVRLEDEVRL